MLLGPLSELMHRKVRKYDRLNVEEKLQSPHSPAACKHRNGFAREGTLRFVLPGSIQWPVYAFFRTEVQIAFPGRVAVTRTDFGRSNVVQPVTKVLACIAAVERCALHDCPGSIQWPVYEFFRTEVHIALAGRVPVKLH